MLRLSLATRAFIFSFVPVCIALLAITVAINTAVHRRVRQDLRESLKNSDDLLNQASAEHARQNALLLAKLTDSAGLKAAVGLLSEGDREPATMGQIRRTIEAQLLELQSASLYDLLAVSTVRGKLLAATALPNISSQNTPPGILAVPTESGLAEIQGVLFQIQVVPIEVGGETAAFLSLGRRFALEHLLIAGEAVLLRSGRVVRSTFSPAANTSLETQLRSYCPDVEAACDVLVSGETYLVSTLQRAQLGANYRLLGLRSLDIPERNFSRAFLPILIAVSAGGAFFALACTLLMSRSVSRPLSQLASQLESSAKSGMLSDKLDAINGVREVDLVADAFNQLVDAERQSREQLVRARQAAESASRLKTEFLMNVSHELRTPLNGVLGMADLLLATTLTEEQGEYAGTVRSSARALCSLIDDVLDFSELETGRLQLKQSEMNVGVVLNDVIAATRAQAANKPISVEGASLNALPQCQFLGAESRIRQVLMQLCQNAVKFTKLGSIRISVQCIQKSQTEVHCKFRVEDTGIGIAKEKLSLVFERFTQLDGSLTRSQGGTGIGLSIAKGLVELMGGTIGISSSLGVGSEFWFVVPLQVANGTQTVSASHELSSAPSCG
jgi:signal transduction histidine kinase